MSTVAPRAMAQAIAVAMDMVAGKGSAKITQDERGVLTVTPAQDQIEPIRRVIKKASSGEPSVKVDFMPIIGPMIALRAIPVIALAAGALFFAGYYVRGRKAR